MSKMFEINVVELKGASRFVLVSEKIKFDLNFI
jgi:hypothetical protein